MKTLRIPQKTELLTPVDHLRGSLDAAITIIEYGDFECPICKQAAGALNVVLARFATQVRLVFRHFPLEQAHPHALFAAQAAECAGGQGRFWEMHDLLFEHQQRLELDQLFLYASLLRLDMDRFRIEMHNEIYLPLVREHQRRAQWSGVRATPGFIINGRIQDVSYGMHALIDVIEELTLDSKEAKSEP
jgi:protein-disulfide isomerase